MKVEETPKKPPKRKKNADRKLADPREIGQRWRFRSPAFPLPVTGRIS
jgi:hypothetical protein